jgi:hypothetical protein
MALSALSGAFASPLVTRIETIKHLLGRDNFEWTALGDSYASGVGGGEYIKDSYRCLRYDHAYPVVMNGDSRLPSGDHKFNNVVCSGSNSTEVNLYQFMDKDTSGVPSSQYGEYPQVPFMPKILIGQNKRRPTSVWGARYGYFTRWRQ